MKIFITDGSSDSFFTAFFDAYSEKDCIITSCENVQPRFDSVVVRTESDGEKCERVKRGIL